MTVTSDPSGTLTGRQSAGNEWQRLTKPQVQRLWDLDPFTSETLFAALVDIKFLRRTRQDAHVRADVG